MDTKRNTQDEGGKRTLHVRVDPVQLDRFREVVALDERTVSQDLRRYIAQRVAAADGLEQAA